MQTQNLTAAHKELFKRGPDEIFPDFDTLYAHCSDLKQKSSDRWHSPTEIVPLARAGRLMLEVGDEEFDMCDWSFAQLCKLGAVSKDTVNKLSVETAERVLAETLPQGGKPMQVLSYVDVVRSVHGAAYTRLHNVELLSVVREFATDFQPPQKAIGGGTGLYCGEQDLFVFLIDPLGWCEIEDQAFAPGFFIWNSEVGCRSVGIQTFWFQKVCANHIVWDAVEVVDFSRKHTANVHECLNEIRRHIEQLVAKRDQRRDGFARTMAKAFQQSLGTKADDVAKLLQARGIPRDLAKRALASAEGQGGFTIFSIVDALTRFAAEQSFAGDRTDIDAKASQLLELVDA